MSNFPSSVNVYAHLPSCCGASVCRSLCGFRNLNKIPAFIPCSSPLPDERHSALLRSPQPLNYEANGSFLATVEGRNFSTT